MARTVKIGNQDFGEIIGRNCFYVDKTGFIKEWWENEDDVTLITRPRRFGKTLNMSMLNYFFSINHKGDSHLFEGLDIWRSKKYRELQGTYPVIYLSFAGVKQTNYKNTRKYICKLITNLYLDYRFLIDEGFLRGVDITFFNSVMPDMDDVDAAESLKQLSKYLSKYYGKKVIILLDEYDTPMQEAYVNGYWDEMADFTRGLFNSAFKTNPYLERAIMTGITRVSKESVFSDLNNLEVITTTSPKYETAFGFTEKEVQESLSEFGLQDKMAEVKRWYDGFQFGKCDSIYNPWSITNFLDVRQFAPYWANSSSNALIGKLIQEGGREIKTRVENLINGASFMASLDEQIVFSQLSENEDAIWSLLLASGYLKVINLYDVDYESGKGFATYELMLTNLEAAFVFRKMISGWFAVCSAPYNHFIQALLQNNLTEMNRYLNNVAMMIASNFDSGKKPSEYTAPEKFYHGLVLGLILELRDTYVITSNRESGYGRYDLLLEPRNLTDEGIILEFKVVAPETEKGLDDTAQAAIRQIINKKYAVTLEEKGISREKVRIYGFAFRGKEVFIDGGYLNDFVIPV